MQKFTRPLTREIELGGERLAVTVAEDGVTIRPVGSRRTPPHFSWEALLCAMMGHLPAGATPTLDEVEQALHLLRGGSAAKHADSPPASSLRSTGPAEIPALLVRLDVWLSRHRDGYHEALLPGATEEDLDSLGQVLGRKVPPELRLWLSWHNGQHEDLLGAFYEAFNLMSAAQIAAAWQDRCARHEPDWDSAWIPFLDDHQDNLLVLDPGEPGCAVREIWRGQEEHSIVAPTLRAWLERFVTEVEAGRFAEDTERGEFHHLRT
ncbi:MAG: SMI1/KNR4 family protein [Gemmataceae bacterium]